jgi:MFS family permease
MGSGNVRKVLLVISVTTLASFITGLNARLGLVGFPIIAHDLNAGVDGMLWIIQGYMLGSTIVQLIVGGLADVYGRVRLFNLGFIVFTVGALAAGLSTDWFVLALARVLQGVGGAFLMSLSITILTDNVPQGLLGTWLGINQIAWRVGAMLGLTISGVIIDVLGWRWLYLIQAPVTVLALFWSLTTLKETYKPLRPKCLDITGFTLFTTSLTLLLTYLTLIFRGVPPKVSVLMLTSYVILLTSFIVWECRSGCSALDLTIFKNWQFAGGIISQILYSLGFGASLTMLVILLEVGKGMSATLTGLGVLPFEASFLVFGILGGRLSDKYGYAPITTIGLIMSTTALYILSKISANIETLPLLITTVLLGIGTGLFTAPNTSSIMSAVSPDKRGVASALRTLSFNIGFLISLNIAFLILINYIPFQEASQIILLGEAVEAVGMDEKLITAISNAFIIQAVFMALAIPFSISRLKYRSK